MSQIVDRQEVFSTPWFSVVAKSVAGWNPDDPYYVLELDDYVSIVALTEAGEVLLVRQFRPVVEQETLELPSGHVETGELPEVTAVRELLEETGFEAGEVILLGCLTSDVGRLANRMWCYLMLGVKASPKTVDIEEGIELVICSQDELVRHIVEGRFDHALDMAAILLAVLKGYLSI